MLTALINGTIFTGYATITGKALLIEDGRIIGLAAADEIPSHAVTIPCDRNYIAPGLIDLQVYGAGGQLFAARPSADSLTTMTNGLVQSGTTSFLLTLATNSPEVFDKAIETVQHADNQSLLGLHFEGPYLNPLRKGAHPDQYIRSPHFDEIRRLLERTAGSLRMMTIAAELFDSATIDLLLQHNVTISIGHSNATYAEAVNAFAQGVSTATHLFNAMPPLHHREPGLCAAIFETPGLRASIIADGIHADFRMVSLAKKLLGERLFLITDAVEETQEGPYIHVRRPDRFTLPDGTLSGSNLTLLKAVQNCVQQSGIPLEEALRMASTYPAQIAGSYDRGKIAPGCRADIIVFTKDFVLKEVFCNGKNFPDTRLINQN